MPDDEKKSEIETGFGTGLRAKLGRGDAGDGAENVSAALADGPVEAPALNGEPNGDVEALRAELAAALDRERDLRTELATQAVIVPSPEMGGLESDLATRAAEPAPRAARLAATEAELEERERRVSEQVAMVRAEKERLSEIETRVVTQDALSSEREAQVQARLQQAKDADREREKL